MSEPTSTSVTVRYWAAARAATGVEEEHRPPGLVGEVLAAAAADHPALQPVLAVASILRDGVSADAAERAEAGTTLEVLPPFAGG